MRIMRREKWFAKVQKWRDFWSAFDFLHLPPRISSVEAGTNLTGEVFLARFLAWFQVKPGCNLVPRFGLGFLVPGFNTYNSTGFAIPFHNQEQKLIWFYLKRLSKQMSFAPVFAQTSVDLAIAFRFWDYFELCENRNGFTSCFLLHVAKTALFWCAEFDVNSNPAIQTQILN